MRYGLVVMALLAGACRGRAGASEAPRPAADAAATPGASSTTYADWYPSDITPPAGTQYHCALTALPRDLPGIPEGDRRFINHAYSMVLAATQAKLLLLRALESTDGLEAPLEQYLHDVRRARSHLADEPVPAGLEAFASDLVTALDLQQAFFVAGVERRRGGASLSDVYTIPEGRKASQHLFSAWARMQQRYPAWGADVRDSVYHHLCALDLF